MKDNPILKCKGDELLMTVAEYLVDFLIDKYQVTDVFGIPGGVILKLIEEFDKRQEIEDLSIHLMYHEQAAGFAACGYAQASGKLGVAYATRGPGIANMIVCIAEAYQESLPVLFITAHSKRNTGNMRFEYDQEIDFTKAVKEFCKYSVSIDSVDIVKSEINYACEVAMQGRKGPVLLDFSSSLWSQDIRCDFVEKDNFCDVTFGSIDKAIDCIEKSLKNSKRPIILIGDGVRQAGAIKELQCLSEIGIPILSSRASQDLLKRRENYFGYIGSHGTRYSNCILLKADLIVAIGNRMSFPVHSKSFWPVVETAKIVRIDIDEREFERVFPSCVCFCLDAKQVLKNISKRKIHYFSKDWIATCHTIKNLLNDCDITQPVEALVGFLNKRMDVSYVCDVGNNEFWFSRAYEYVRPSGQVYYSKVFGTLGLAIAKAIGVFYATKKPVICIIGDQGFQYNIQEIQYITSFKLPIIIVVVNNNCSGMIRDHELSAINGKLIHVSSDTGYTVPELYKIANAYGVKYINFSEQNMKFYVTEPYIIEIDVDTEVMLTPTLPPGRICDDMEPLLERELYKRISEL